MTSPRIHKVGMSYQFHKFKWAAVAVALVIAAFFIYRWRSAPAPA